MLFTSVTYFFFLALVLLFVLALPWRFGRWVLITASYVFYGAVEPWYCLLLLTSTLVDYFAALAIVSHRSSRRAILTFSIVINLSLLGVFKYLDFGIDNLNVVLGWMNIGEAPALRLLLPIGISFYTFQTMSYTIDVYRGKIAPTRDFAAFALYVSFFPQLVAGPIERARNLLPQLIEKQPVTRSDLEAGFERILWGLVKKTVFADRLAVIVNPVYANPAAYSSPELMLATACFSFQLYLDFSAYTDIAIGSARVMGIRLSENFRYPFLAVNPSDFWARWHMTLTSWFRDYVYYPLGGTRRSGKTRTALSLVLVMGLMGLWHGAEWHYVLFGLVSGLVLAVYVAVRLAVARPRRRLSLWQTLLAVAAGNVLINLIMVFFRARDAATAWQVISGFVNNGWALRPGFGVAIALLILLWTVHIVRGSDWGRSLLARDWPAAVRAGWWVALLMLITYGAVDKSDRFIYFQF